MKKSFLRISLVASAAIMVPACGANTNSPSGGTTGVPPLQGVPVAIVGSPSSPKHSVVPVDFTLTDSSGTPVSVSIYFSDDGGASFHPATAAFGNGSLTGLASSPTGVSHTFLWNSLDDGVGAGAVVFGGFTSYGTINTQVQVRVIPAGGTEGTTATFAVDNTMNRWIGTVTAAFPQNPFAWEG